MKNIVQIPLNNFILMYNYIELPYNIYSQIPKHGDVHVIRTDLNIKKLEDIIRTILREFCDVNVMGFNNTENFYWCKIEEKAKCILYSEIRLIANDADSSVVIIINESDYHLKLRGLHSKYKITKINFLEAMNEGLCLYQNSAFARCFVDNE